MVPQPISSVPPRADGRKAIALRRVRYFVPVLLVALAMVLAWHLAPGPREQPNTYGKATLTQPALKNFILHDAPKPVAGIVFENSRGELLSLADFRGKFVLLNVWATWCGPCRSEMPSLDRLQSALGAADFQVLPLSIDRGGIAVVRKFYAEAGLRHLPIFVDSAGKATRELAIVGLPATLLIDREGRELGRLIGPAEWDGPAIVEFLRGVMGGNHGASDAADDTNRLKRRLAMSVRWQRPSGQSEQK